MPVNSQTIIAFVIKLALKILKTAFTAMVVFVFTYCLVRFLDNTSGYLLGLYLDWKGITLTHEERYLIYLFSDYMEFYGGMLLIIFLLLFPRVRKKILFI